MESSIEQQSVFKIIMKEFIKVLGLAIVGTALMLCFATIAANILRPYDREIVGCVLASIAAVFMLAPLFTMECKNEWVVNASMFCMAYFPIQIIIIGGLL